jgi:hypothetical protein
MIKEYKKGKELIKLEKIKEEIAKILGTNRYNYNFKYEVSYKISLEITPCIRNDDFLKISNDFKDIQDYLITNNMSYRLLWWPKIKELEVTLN